MKEIGPRRKVAAGGVAKEAIFDRPNEAEVQTLSRLGQK
jgi:hypothetical protein